MQEEPPSIEHHDLTFQILAFFVTTLHAIKALSFCPLLLPSFPEVIVLLSH